MQLQKTSRRSRKRAVKQVDGEKKEHDDEDDEGIFICYFGILLICILFCSFQDQHAMQVFHLHFNFQPVLVLLLSFTGEQLIALSVKY